MVGGTCRGAAVFSLYFQRRPGGSYRPDLASVRKLWMVGGTCRGAAVFSLYFQRGNLRQSVLARCLVRRELAFDFLCAKPCLPFLAGHWDVRNTIVDKVH